MEHTLTNLPPGRLYLKDTDDAPPTLLDYLVAHFPHVSRESWEHRLEGRRVRLSDGTPVRPDTPYRPGETVCYWREVDDEPEAPESEVILYEDARLVVADKPHGMPVTPAGDYLARTLLVRLQERTRNPDLVPAHRLDRETAGVVLFVRDASLRGRYHQLFPEEKVDREYLAVARLNDDPKRRSWTVENRLGPGEPWFRQRVGEGESNAASEITLVGKRGGLGLFRIRPRTGKKHQIRVHMAAIGYPILGDPLYPEVVEKKHSDPPLQLLARTLSFTDPVSGEPLRFRSCRTLLLPGPENERAARGGPS